MSKHTSHRRITGAVVEALEERQLMTLTIDIRLASGAKSIDVTTVNQVVNLQIWAEVTDSQDAPATDGLISTDASFISTNVGTGPVAGNLAARVEGNWDASGAEDGTSQDLNGDGNLDVGGTDPNSLTGYFEARYINAPQNDTAASNDTGGDGVIVGNAVEFEIGTLTYTVTNLNLGGEADINFAQRVPTSEGVETSVWTEDNTGKNPSNGTVAAGTPFKVFAPIATPPPVANNDTATTTLNTPSASINVLANDTVYAPLLDTSVAIVAQGADGTAVANSDGTITYTPSQNFVGSDSFTYTVQDSYGNTSNAATVTVDTGVSISNAKGADKSVSYTDPSGALATVTLNRGTATMDFTGTGTASISHAGAVTLSGSALTLNGLTLSGTTAASTLSIHAHGGGNTVTLGNITDSSVLGGIVAPQGNFTGAISLGGLVHFQGAQINGASIQLAAGSPAVTITVPGAVTDATINASAVPFTFAIGSLNNSTVTALAAKNLRAPAGLSGSSLTLTGSGTPFRIQTGAISDLTLSAPSDPLIVTASSVSASNLTASAAQMLNVSGAFSESTISTSATGAAGRNIVMIHGAVSSATIQTTGGLVSFLAGSLASTSMTAGPSGSIRILGSVSSSTLSFSGPGGAFTVVNQFSVAGQVANSTLYAQGSVGNLIAGSLLGSNISAGTNGNVLVSTATTANLGSAAIKSLRLTSRSGDALSGSSIVAQTIKSASLQTVDTTTAGGLAAAIYGQVTFTANGAAEHLKPTQLTITQTFGDVEIAVI